MYLDSNRLSGEIPAELGNLASLRRLWVHDNELSGEIPTRLGKLRDLDQIFLGGTNSLSGCLPAAWESLDTLVDDLDTLGLDFCAVP